MLGSNADFKVRNNSIYGQAIGDENNAGYSQIISLGGNASSDDIMAESGSNVYGRIYAAAHTLTVSGANWFGSALVRQTVVTNGTFAVDEGSLGTTLHDPTKYAVLTRWDA